MPTGALKWRWRPLTSYAGQDQVAGLGDAVIGWHFVIACASFKEAIAAASTHPPAALRCRRGHWGVWKPTALPLRYFLYPSFKGQGLCFPA